MTLQHLDTLIGFATVMLGISLLITVMTQLISAVLGLRGTNLRWGLKTLLENVDPTLKDPAQKITEDILHHRLISDSTFSKFWVSRRWRLANAIRRTELIDILKKMVSDPNPPPWAQGVRDKQEKLEASINTWFDSTMDRVSQRFATSMRIWTIGISLALAGILHLDAIALLKRLSEDSTLRSGLVARAQQVMQQTENIIGSSGATNVFQSAVQQLRQRHPEATRNLTDPPPLPSQEMAKLWLSGQVRGQSNAPQLLVEYQQIVSSNIVARAPELMGSVSLVHDDLTAAGLELWPDYSKIDGEDYLPTKSAFWGMLATAALLSLGAPFWFHGLKTLTNLRPMVAAQVQKEVEGKADPKH